MMAPSQTSKTEQKLRDASLYTGFSAKVISNLYAQTQEGGSSNPSASSLGFGGLSYALKSYAADMRSSSENPDRQRDLQKSFVSFRFSAAPSLPNASAVSGVHFYNDLDRGMSREESNADGDNVRDEQ
jgi:hypothetical protein